MTSHAEHLKTLEREIRNAGLKPVVERTEGGHMRISFEIHGLTHFIVTSWAPGLQRTTLNARAEIRKILRAHLVVDKQNPNVKSPLEKALSMPSSDPEPFMDRIAHLERDLATMLDMYADLVDYAAARDKEFNEQAKPTLAQQVLPPSPPPPPPPAPPKAAPVVKDTGKAHELLLSLEYQWLPLAEIMRREKPRSYGAVTVSLNTLKKKGLVENGERGMWRKVRPDKVPLAKEVQRNGHDGQHAAL
jgi:hypothetical protein